MGNTRRSRCSGPSRSATSSTPTPRRGWSGRPCATRTRAGATWSGAKPSSGPDRRTCAARPTTSATSWTEITRAAPQLGEAEALETEAKRLAHADELGRMARELEQALDTAGLARAAKLVTSLERLDATVARWQELLDGAFAHVQELAQAARDYAAGIEGDPGRLAAVEQRRDVLFRLMQKYGPALPDVLATRDQA